MITFLDKFTGARIGTSRKVMSSFFKLNAFRFEEIVSTGWCDFFLVRHPATRWLSMIQDKCRVNVGEDPQRCQRRIMEAFNLETPEELRQLSLNALADRWWAVIGTDEHFVPQVYGYSPERAGGIVQIEDGLPILGEKLGINFSKKVNETLRADILEAGEWGRVIRNFYNADFLSFGYHLRPVNP